MKIISWNCNCAFRNKMSLLQTWQPDIMIIQESESPDYLAQKGVSTGAASHLWFGKSPHKGLGIFTFGNYRAELAGFYNEEFPYIVPVEISGEGKRFLLFAVWTQTCGKNDSYNGYVVYATRAMQYYRDYLTPETIVIGDFNSNQKWLKQFKREYNHDALIRTLACCGMQSFYHYARQCSQGEEADPTIFMYKNPNKGYYIDYAFLHQSRLAQVKKFAVGNYGDWIKYSDHMPLFLEI